jgi:hypothetical protein
MKNADRSEKAVPHYIVVPIKVAGVVRTMEASVIEGPTAYSMLLGRNWKRANVIGDYANKSYYICGDQPPWESRSHAQGTNGSAAREVKDGEEDDMYISGGKTLDGL